MRFSSVEDGRSARGPADPNEVMALRAVVTSLVLSSLLSVALEVSRIEHTGTRDYLFLIWNLLLAWIPAAVAFALDRVQRRGARPGLLALLALAWLLFFPNAPYIITDFVHLTSQPFPHHGLHHIAPHSAPLWFDVLLISSFAWTGLLLGFVSLKLVQLLATAALGVFLGWVMTATALLLAAFGIYIGRFEVRNSWDVILRPGPLVRDTWHQLTTPGVYPRMLGVTVSYAIFLLLTYGTLFPWLSRHTASRQHIQTDP